MRSRLQFPGRDGTRRDCGCVVERRPRDGGRYKSGWYKQVHACTLAPLILFCYVQEIFTVVHACAEVPDIFVVIFVQVFHTIMVPWPGSVYFMLWPGDAFSNGAVSMRCREIILQTQAMHCVSLRDWSCLVSQTYAAGSELEEDKQVANNINSIQSTTEN